MEVEKSAGAVVFYRGQEIEYLLLLSTYWGFPKGRIEENEDERTAALREVREETGLEVTLLDGFRELDPYWSQRKGQRIRKEAIFFVGEAESKQAKISWEHEDLIWLPYQQALEKLKFAGLRNLLIRAEEFLTNNQPAKA